MTVTERPSSCCTVPAPPSDDDLAMDLGAARRVLSQVAAEGLPVAALRYEQEGAWWPCDPTELLDGARIASVGQRPGCRGVVTAVYFWGDAGLMGAWLADRDPGSPERVAWRVALLQALLHDERDA